MPLAGAIEAQTEDALNLMKKVETLVHVECKELNTMAHYLQAYNGPRGAP